jgi:hypothetical protein
MQRVDNGLNDRGVASQRCFALRLNITDSTKAAKITRSEPVGVFIGRYRGTIQQKYSFVFYRTVSGEESLDLEPLQFAHTPDQLIEKLAFKITEVLATGSLTVEELTVDNCPVDRAYLEELIARAWGSTHTHCWELNQFRDAKLASSTKRIHQILDYFGLETPLG